MLICNVVPKNLKPDQCLTLSPLYICPENNFVLSKISLRNLYYSQAPFNRSLAQTFMQILYNLIF